MRQVKVFVKLMRHPQKQRRSCEDRTRRWSHMRIEAEDHDQDQVSEDKAVEVPL